MPVTTPYSNPNWLKRFMRLQTPKGPKQADMNNPQQAARGLFDMGIQIGEDGTARPTQNFGGMLGKASSQINSLSPGTKPGQFSSLNKPLNSGNEQYPDFFPGKGSSGDFASMLQQRNQMSAASGGTGDRTSRIAQAKEAGTFDTIRNTFNERAKSFGQMMDEAGNISTAAPYRPGMTTPTVQSQTENRTRLEEGAAGRKLMAEAGGAPRVTIPTITTPAGTVPQMGARNIEGKYGSGFSTMRAPGSGEGLIGGRPFSEVLQGLANKPGIARPGDKFQPKSLTPAQNKVLEEAAKKSPRR